MRFPSISCGDPYMYIHVLVLYIHTYILYMKHDMTYVYMSCTFMYLQGVKDRLFLLHVVILIYQPITQ